MAKSASEIAKKWVQRTSQSSGAYKEGVMAVTEAPGKAAARRAEAMVQRLQEQLASGELQRRMESVSLEEWKRLAVEKGAGRLGSGVQAAEGKFQQFMSEWMPIVENVKSQLPARGSFEDNMQRMIMNAQKLHEHRRK